MGPKGRAAMARAFAQSKAQEARRQKLRLLVHSVLIGLGIWSFSHTDVHSTDPFEAGTLVVMDMLFCVYLLSMMLIEIWRR